MRLILAATLSLLTLPAAACGPDSDCTVAGDRTYRYYVPTDADAPVGAFFHAHGYRGSANGAMGNQSLRAMADRLGMAFVALNADAEDWNLAHHPRNPSQSETTEPVYVEAVIEDIATRIALDRGRLIATGFSAGGMMTWTLACEMSETFAGFVPYAGTFWAPSPATCPTPPATLVHIHGNADSTVPQEGRAIGGARQGDLHRVLETYGSAGGYGAPAPVPSRDDMRCEGRENAGGDALVFCEFDGGHSYSPARVEWAIEWILARL
ncbi:alpha/beta hydrolase family esterase [Gymnodinialimonas ceratoperidinii]|uniref:Dienelactone hydrolase family protein n=1 Tax=Gymnodinialimonas ceratoperidinii TaxID=2856823 RepID=A0A8F6TX97_9RHOB|nr:dienelactone hydrolase family protein [Gymnodinialimonas ceratoperidinii]QXT40138.1 dienelactone hydrolase family protein [Gymnodinialimonas ceratoperidinii]